MLQKYINQIQHPWNILVWIAMIVVVLVIALLLTKINKLIFKHIQKQNSGAHLLFLQHLISVLIVLGFIILVISSFAGVQSVWTTIFGGTAIVSAVVAFAAQDIIKDILAGIMISIHRPFEQGDRIVLEDGTAGIVEEMTLRHVVLIGPESLRYCIPNHVINAMKVSHFSYGTTIRSVAFNFSVGYDSDMDLVKKVIADAVAESEYSVEGFTDKEGNAHYGEVYFMSFAESALIMRVTVYYQPTNRTEKVIDDINVRVREALIANNIEIPYSYVNVVDKSAAPTDGEQ